MTENIKLELEKLFAKFSTLKALRLALQVNSLELMTLQMHAFSKIFGVRLASEFNYWVEEENPENAEMMLDDLQKKAQYRFWDVCEQICQRPDAIDAHIFRLFGVVGRFFVDGALAQNPGKLVETIDRLSRTLLGSEDARVNSLFVRLGNLLSMDEIIMADGAMEDYLRRVGIDPEIFSKIDKDRYRGFSAN